jgi:hypothetical protein
MHTCKGIKRKIEGKIHLAAVKKPLPFEKKEKILQIA